MFKRRQPLSVKLERSQHSHSKETRAELALQGRAEDESEAFRTITKDSVNERVLRVLFF